MEEVKFCTDCGEEMTVRENRYSEKFWGCTSFPECRYTENIEDDDEIPNGMR